MRHPTVAEIPKDLARQVNKQLRKHRPYTKAIVKSPGKTKCFMYFLLFKISF